ncbi:MAG: hypothetical protein LBT05_16270 [Planctomycetaceae bacterium]|jgi:hypothetical protein|nr:hypothetical protein [Planctomycetaceae bacterium]
MRRKKNPQGSLELFLDVVCNTFGGILFIAILVAVLTRMIKHGETEKPIVDTVPSDIVLASQNRLEQLLAEQEQLQKMNAVFYDSASDKSELLQEIFDLEKQRGELLKQKTQQTATVVDNVKTIADAENLWNQTLRELEELRKQYQTQQRIFFETAVKDKIQEIRLPRMKDSYKRKVALIVQGDKLFFWHKTLPNGISGGLNEEQFTAFDNGSSIETYPKPWTGFDYAKPSDARTLASLKKFNSSQVAFDVVLFQDSYDSFHLLRKIFVQNNFEYSLFLGSRGNRISDRGGTSKPVQ